jgi:tetratricopeptide (TPR) repeat protein
MNELDRHSGEADTLVGDAIASLDAGQPQEAEMLCRRALTLQPRHRGALGVLGVVLHGAARYGEAEQVFLELTEAQPDDPVQWMNLGTARRGLGNPDAALAAYARAAELGAASDDFYYNLGLTHLDRKDFESALAVFKRARQLAPEDAEIRYQYAHACYECLRAEQAIEALAGWKSLHGLTSELVARIGNLLMNLGAAEQAEEALRAALADGATDPGTSVTLVKMLERTNRVSEARTILEQALTDRDTAGFEGGLALARATLAQRDGDDELAVRLLRQVLGECRDFDRRQYQLFPLAKSLDALGRHEEAFETLQEAHRSQLAHLQMAHPLLTVRSAPTLVITEYGCDPVDVATWSDSDAPPVEASPVFIVAFPRSGTTLLELTLDAHPELQSMDEQPFLQNALEDLTAQGIRYPMQLGRLDASQLESVRRRYWERVRSKVTLARGQRLVDKNPLNLLRLPVIRRIFPNSRIIVAVRHPCDVLLSCYMQHFRAPEFALLCNDLETMAAGYRRSFDFWYQQAELLRPAMREVRYESFVADFQNEVRGIVDFLELPWNDSLLAPAQRAREKGFISTPSYSQVVQPINRKSVGRWRAYERHLAPVLPYVQPYLERWGYDA